MEKYAEQMILGNRNTYPDEQDFIGKVFVPYSGGTAVIVDEVNEISAKKSNTAIHYHCVVTFVRMSATLKGFMQMYNAEDILYEQ